MKISKQLFEGKITILDIQGAVLRDDGELLLDECRAMIKSNMPLMIGLREVPYMTCGAWYNLILIAHEYWASHGSLLVMCEMGDHLLQWVRRFQMDDCIDAIGDRDQAIQRTLDNYQAMARV